MMTTCCKCGGRKAESAYNLSVEDAGAPGGQGPCGDTHKWVAVVTVAKPVAVDTAN